MPGTHNKGAWHPYPVPEWYSIEVFNAVGDTIAVTTVPAAALETVREDEVLSARTL